MKNIVIALVGLGLSSFVVAADLAPATSRDWTGFYAGLNGGMAQGSQTDVTTSETLNNKFLNRNRYGSISPSGAFGGIQTGYNWQHNNFLLGMEGDIQGGGISDSTSSRAAIGGGTFYNLTTSGNLNWFGTVRLRAGYAVDNFLVYATGGMAVGSTEYQQNFTDNVQFSARYSEKKTRTGYALGAGIEYAMTKNFSVKLEYQYIDLGRANVDAPESGPVPGYVLHTEFRPSFQIARLGVNWKF